MDELIKQQLPNVISGCTANVCLIIKKTIYCANCGDSRSIINKGANAFPLSVDHKPDDQLEKERVQKAGGDVYDGRINGNLNLSRAFGDLEYKVNHKDKQCLPQNFMITAYPDVSTNEITKDVNLIVMGCDGIWECKENQYIINYFANKKDLQSSSREFLDNILSKSSECATVGMDNMTLIIIKIK